jgi:hypothetical protein
LNRAKEKRRTKEEQEVHNSMKVFARFQSPEEHEAFVAVRVFVFVFFFVFFFWL